MVIEIEQGSIAYTLDYGDPLPELDDALDAAQKIVKDTGEAVILTIKIIPNKQEDLEEEDNE